MPNLRAQASMHARQGQTPEALGARERARQDASQARPHAGGHDNPPADRRASVRHAQGMDGQHRFLTRTLEKVKTEMSLQVLAYNMKRMINIFGVNPLMQAIAA